VHIKVKLDFKQKQNGFKEPIITSLSSKENKERQNMKTFEYDLCLEVNRSANKNANTHTHTNVEEEFRSWFGKKIKLNIEKLESHILKRG